MPNSDENWFFEYTAGQTTGSGWGIYGELGNKVYEDEQRRKREEEDRWTRPSPQHKDRAVSTDTAVPPPTVSSDLQEEAQTKNWSTLTAIIGFLVGSSLAYDQADPNVGPALVVGFVAGFLCGRFYKPLVVVGIVALVLWMLVT